MEGETERQRSQRSLGQASTSRLSQISRSMTSVPSKRDLLQPDASSAYRKQHLNELLFPLPAPTPTSPWTVSDTSRRFPALARRKGQLPESVFKSNQRHRSRKPTTAALMGSPSFHSQSLDAAGFKSGSSQGMLGTGGVRGVEDDDDVQSVQDFHKEDSRAILLPYFSGSGSAMRHADMTTSAGGAVGADISFRTDVTKSEKHLLSSFSEVFQEELTSKKKKERGNRTIMSGIENETLFHQKNPMLLKVRVPGHQPLINPSVMPGYEFMRDLDSKLIADYPALAFALNTSYMSLPSSRNESLLLANWTQQSLKALRAEPTISQTAKSKLDSLEDLTSNLTLAWEGLPQAQVLALAMTDLVRQVGAHCAERSAVIAFLWNEMTDLFENRTNSLEDIIDKYDAKISVLLAEAPRLRKQSRLFEDAQKKATLESEIAKDANQKFKVTNSRLKDMSEKIDTVFSRMVRVENYLESRMRNIRWQKAIKRNTAFNLKTQKQSLQDASELNIQIDISTEEKLDLIEEKLQEHQNRLKDFEDYAVKVAKKNTAIAHLKIAASISEDLQEAVDQMSIEKKNKSDLERKLNMFTSGNIEELEKQVGQSLLELSLPEIEKLLSSISSDIAGGALGNLSPEQIAKILSYLPSSKAAEVIAHTDVAVIAHAMFAMNPKARLRVLGHVIAEITAKLLSHMTLIEEEGTNFTLELSSQLVSEVDDERKVRLLETYSNKHAIHSMERLQPKARVEVFNRINTESAIKLLLQSSRSSEQLASILSRCEESAVSSILQCMLNESNKNFDAKQKVFACQLILEFDPEFAANVILCTASLTKKSWPQASTWTHICSNNLDIDDTINIEGQCAKILLTIARTNLHRAAEFLLKIRERSFAATLLKILLNNVFGNDNHIGLTLIQQMVSGMNIPIDTISLMQLLSQDLTVNHTVATTAIDDSKFGLELSKNVIEKVPSSLVVNFLSKSRIDAYNISSILKHISSEAKADEIIKGLDNTLRELVTRYLAEGKSKERVMKKRPSVKRNSSFGMNMSRRTSRAKSIEELRKNIRPAVQSRRSLVGTTPMAPLNPVLQSLLDSQKEAGSLSPKEVSPIARRRSRIGEELAKLAEVKKASDKRRSIIRRESIRRSSIPEAIRAIVIPGAEPPSTPPTAATPVATPVATPTKAPLAEQPNQDQNEAGDDTETMNKVAESPFKTAVQLKSLQERFLGHHRRQWFANHDTRLKVALAQVSDPSLEERGTLNPSQSKVKNLLSLGKQRSKDWLNRMIDAVLGHLTEHQQQHSGGNISQQLTFMISMSFLDHSVKSFNSEHLDSYSTNTKVSCMSGAMRVASWNMHEAFQGYFHKQYGTGTIVEEYLASMIVTLKAKLQDGAKTSATILNIIDHEETSYDQNWSFMHRILWNMISNYWGGDVLARFVAALSAINSFVEAEHHKRSSLNITSLNYEDSSEWLCRRRAEVIADTVLGIRSHEAREIFEERITDMSVAVDEEEEEMYLDIIENDVGGVIDEITLEKYNARHGDSDCCWKVLKGEFLYQLCLEARHFEIHLGNAILDIFRLCDKDNNGYMDQKEAEAMLEECIAMLRLQEQIRKTAPDERLAYNLKNFNTIFKQFWVTAVLVDESSGSTPPSSMHVIEKLVNEAKAMTVNPTLDWAYDVEEISFTGFSAAVRMTNILRAYIQMFFTPPREDEIDLEDMDVFHDSQSMEDLSAEVRARNSSVAVITKRRSVQMREQVSPILAKSGVSEPILRGLLHRVQEEKHGPSMIKMYLKLVQDLSTIQINRVRKLAYGPVVAPPEDKEKKEEEKKPLSLDQQLKMQEQNLLYPSFAGSFHKCIKDAEYSMLMLNGKNFSEILGVEIKSLGKSLKVRELIEIIRQLNEMSNAVKEALIGIVVRKKLQHKHYKHKALNYTKNASP